MNVRKLVERVLFEDGYDAYLELVELAQERGIRPASLNDFYLAYGAKEFERNFTVPAVNLRGMTFATAKELLRVARQLNGFWVFEIARSEMGYTGQYPMEYAAEVLGAAVEVGWEGPLFLQGDHFQFTQENDISNIKMLVDEALQAGFLNIDIDGSTLVELDRPTIREQQEKNVRVTVEMLKYIREKEGEKSVSIGGEIGHIGSKNSTAEEMGVFLAGVKDGIGGLVGLSKVSVQTGTRHGGVTNEEGETQEMEVDFGVIDECSEVVEKYGSGGVVQHGASTLADDKLTIFPEHATMEIHLATGWQNIIMDHPSFPSKLKEEMETWMESRYCDKYASREECVYRERKRAWGEFQREVWEIRGEIVDEIMHDIGKKAETIQLNLGMDGKQKLVRRYA